MSSLKGKKILVTIQELENKEHRGIASYTKSLIKALNKSEAEIWLLVSMDYNKLKFKNYSENFQNSFVYGNIYNINVHILRKGGSMRGAPELVKWLRKFYKISSTFFRSFYQFNCFFYGAVVINSNLSDNNYFLFF